MSVETTANRISYAGNGSTTVFAFPYRFLAGADLVVIERTDSTGAEVVKTITTHYTVADNGNVTMLVAPASGKTLIIYNDPSKTQGVDLRENDSLPAESVEEALDRVTLISQRLGDRLDRSVTLSEGFSPTFDLTLPSDLDDAGGKIPLINDDGDGFAPAADWPDAGGVTAGMEAAQAAAEAAQAAAEAAQAAAETAETNAETAETNAETAATLAQDWATKTTATVDGSDYSAKEWAKGTQTRGTANGGSAKDWAQYTGGTVDNAEYSAKKYATDAAASAAAAAATLASAFFRDVVFFTSASSPVTIDQTHNGKLLVFDSSGGAIAVALPTIAGLALPFNITALCSVAGNDVTFTRGGTDTFMGGGTTKIMSVANTGFQIAADTDTAPDTWSVLEFGSVGDGTVTAVKLATDAVTPIKMEAGTIQDLFNLGLSATVGSNALTVALKQADGSSDASATAPVKIPFRSSTATSGAKAVRSVTGALSVVLSNGSSLGLAASRAGYIFVYAIDNAGTIELALSRRLFKQNELVSTTAEGGAGGADTGTTMYSTTARSNVACRLIGLIEITPGASHAWSASPTRVSVWPFEIPRVYARYTSDAGNVLSRNAWTTLSYEDLDEDAYNSYGSGTFTAPWDGTYSFHVGWEVGGVNSNSTTLTRMNKNGSTVMHGAAGDEAGNPYNASSVGNAMAGTIKLAAGDTLTWQAWFNDGVADRNMTTTAGFNTKTVAWLGF